ncbi:MAG TPA: hypothetical protein PK079_14775 [Leptospiraceae bacterium]|nr:hypothetical protein [Leptospiraceae bacterium]HMW05684.1 hypothetical protein [Leptospiraceae bacterium]HMX33512.1 hypothetical protein [Leptospiraceae bacterium]HMY30283.1 hypothetical protein [Leptospiraceae bacterium]HMZ63636.1 hypothetical protein [Leptospiraceae bacterium]
MAKLIRFSIFILFCLNCYDKNRIDSWEIQKRVALLIESKASQCGNRPKEPLLFINDRPPGEVNQCELDLVNARCPFKTYPWSCVRIF